MTVQLTVERNARLTARLTGESTLHMLATDCLTDHSLLLLLNLLLNFDSLLT